MQHRCLNIENKRFCFGSVEKKRLHVINMLKVARTPKNLSSFPLQEKTLEKKSLIILSSFSQT